MAKAKRRQKDLIVLPDLDLIVLPDIPDPPPLQLKLIAPGDRHVARTKTMSVHDGWRVRVVRVLATTATGTKKVRKKKKGKTHTTEEKTYFQYWTPDYIVHISPDGDEYVEAHGNEKADLLHVGVTRMGKPPHRLRRLATSHHHKNSEREAKLLKRGQKAAKEKLKAKKKKAKEKKSTLSRSKHGTARKEK